MTDKLRTAAQMALEAIEDFDGYRSDISDAIFALREALAEQAAPSAVAAPDGWKLAPVEPTHAMLGKAHGLTCIDFTALGEEGEFTNDELRAIYRAFLDASPQPPAQAQEPPSNSSIKLAEMLLSDCGHSSNNTRLLERVTARVDKHVERVIEIVKPAPAAQGDTEDAARWRDWAAAVAEASANGDGDTPFMKAFSDAIGDSEAPFTTEQFAAWVDAARKQEGKV